MLFPNFDYSNCKSVSGENAPKWLSMRKNCFLIDPIWREHDIYKSGDNPRSEEDI